MITVREEGQHGLGVIKEVVEIEKDDHTAKPSREG